MARADQILCKEGLWREQMVMPVPQAVERENVGVF
jgi:hypothetical protein